jgi:hypothetical protein
VQKVECVLQISYLVKSIVNETMTYFVGKYYTREVNGSSTVVKKYYTAGAKTIAMRTIEGSTNTLNWLLADHLGSTSTTANEDGSWNSTIKYTAFGCPCAARRVLRNTRETSGVTPTKYRYTGQLLEAEVGLYYYVARWSRSTPERSEWGMTRSPCTSRKPIRWYQISQILPAMTDMPMS